MNRNKPACLVKLIPARSINTLKGPKTEVDLYPAILTSRLVNNLTILRDNAPEHRVKSKLNKAHD